MALEETLSDKEVLNATQDAVLNAVGSVADAIESTAAEMSGHDEIFYLSAEFWVAVSFVVAVVALARPVGKILYRMLQKRGEDIAKRIQDAADLKEDAQKLLAEYEKKYRQAEQEAQEILVRSEREINLIKRDSLAKLESDMAAREKEAKLRVAGAQEDAVREITAKTAERAIAAVKKVLAESLDAKDLDKLIDESIEKVG